MERSDSHPHVREAGCSPPPATATPRSCATSAVGPSPRPGVRIGAGCLLSPRHVLTALHLVRPLPAKLSWPVVEKYDGVFRCEVTYEDAREDLAVLTTTDPVAPDPGEAPAEFPLLPAGGPPRLGSAVGYITWLKLPKEAGRAWSFHFAASTVSMLLPGDGKVGPRYLLGDDVAQKGVTGSAAFTPAGELCGVLIRTLAHAGRPGGQAAAGVHPAGHGRHRRGPGGDSGHHCRAGYGGKFLNGPGAPRFGDLGPQSIGRPAHHP